MPEIKYPTDKVMLATYVLWRLGHWRKGMIRRGMITDETLKTPLNERDSVVLDGSDLRFLAFVLHGSNAAHMSEDRLRLDLQSEINKLLASSGNTDWLNSLGLHMEIHTDSIPGRAGRFWASLRTKAVKPRPDRIKSYTRRLESGGTLMADLICIELHERGGTVRQPDNARVALVRALIQAALPGASPEFIRHAHNAIRDLRDRGWVVAEVDESRRQSKGHPIVSLTLNIVPDEETLQQWKAAREQLMQDFAVAS